MVKESEDPFVRQQQRERKAKEDAAAARISAEITAKYANATEEALMSPSVWRAGFQREAGRYAYFGATLTPVEVKSSKYIPPGNGRDYADVMTHVVCYASDEKGRTEVVHVTLSMWYGQHKIRGRVSSGKQRRIGVIENFFRQGGGPFYYADGVKRTVYMKDKSGAIRALSLHNAGYILGNARIEKLVRNGDIVQRAGDATDEFRRAVIIARQKQAARAESTKNKRRARRIAV